MKNGRVQILVSCEYYLPGWKGGGPIKSLASMTEELGDEYDFFIVTGDHDQGDSKPYPGIVADAWQRVGKATVRYLPPRLRSLRWRALLSERSYDLLYLNSFFSADFTIAPLAALRLRLAPPVPVLVAPRGDFAPASLGIKAYKKRPFRAVAHAARLYGNCTWQASFEHEEQDIRRGLPAHEASKARIFVASDWFSYFPVGDPEDGGALAGNGPLRIVFLSRISRVKNLDFALRVLAEVDQPVAFDVYGPAPDRAYRSTCERLMSRLPAHVAAHYKGPLSPEEVRRVLPRHDLFFLPTRGENFGHVVLESMLAGVPVLLSDRTHWRGLAARGVGWDLPLADPAAFARAIGEYARTRTEERLAMRLRARAYAESLVAVQNETSRVQHRAMFAAAARGTTPSIDPPARPLGGAR